MKRMIYCFLPVLLLAAVSGYYLAKNSPAVLRDGAGTASAKGESLTLGAEVEIRYVYDICGHVISEKAARGRFTGKTKKEIEAMGYTVTKFSAEKAVIAKRLYSYCPKHYILRLDGKKLSLCRNIEKTEDEEALWERTLASPPKGDTRSALEAGKVFGSEAEAVSFAASLANNAG